MVNKSTKNRSVVYRKFALLCIELKYLYVAVTRAKSRLIIFDDDSKTRAPIQRIWESLECVDVLTKQEIEDPNVMAKDKFEVFKSGYLESGKNRSSEQDWKI